MSFRQGAYRPVKTMEEMLSRFNEMLRTRISLVKDINGEILNVTLAPNESKSFPHGLRVIPKYRTILRQTGNAVITDVDEYWTDRTIGLLNNSANAVVLTIKIYPE